jgi:hypothetical protein
METRAQDDSNESDSDEATTEVISHTEGLEALDVIFMKRWRVIAAFSRRSTLYQKKITDFVKKNNF